MTPKKTAVDYLVGELTEIFGKIVMEQKEIVEIINHAKDMENQQTLQFALDLNEIAGFPLDETAIKEHHDTQRTS